jgi:hypothetical protein
MMTHVLAYLLYALPTQVTLTDLCLSIGGGLLTLIAFRSLPGLLKITVLQKFRWMLARDTRQFQ